MAHTRSKRRARTRLYDGLNVPGFEIWRLTSTPTQAWLADMIRLYRTTGRPEMAASLKRTTLGGNNNRSEITS